MIDSSGGNMHRLWGILNNKHKSVNYDYEKFFGKDEAAGSALMFWLLSIIYGKKKEGKSGGKIGKAARDFVNSVNM
jgi:hypothetical protein